jgi:amino acid transporter
MVSQLESAFDARRQRILISQSSVSYVKWACLVMEAICVAFIITLVHCEDRVAAMFSLAVFATGAAVCFFLICAYDRPFVGKLAIQPAPLLQVMPEAARPILNSDQGHN